MVLLRADRLALLGGHRQKRTIIFQAVFCAFLVLGCILELKAVLDFSDAMIFLISVPNLIALYLFAPSVKREVESYMRSIQS